MLISVRLSPRPGLGSGFAADAARQALVPDTVQFLARVGAEVALADVETAQDLAILEDLGVPHGRDFFLFRPRSGTVSALISAG